MCEDCVHPRPAPPAHGRACKFAVSCEEIEPAVTRGIRRSAGTHIHHAKIFRSISKRFREAAIMRVNSACAAGFADQPGDAQDMTPVKDT